MFLRNLGRFLRGAFWIKSAHADDGDNADPTPTPGGDGDDASKTFTQADIDRVVGERLARAEAQFATKHELDSLKAKASELDALRGEAAKKEQASKDAALVKSGDLDKLRTDYDERLRAKDTALETSQKLFEATLLDTSTQSAMAAVADQLHEGASETFAEKLRGRLGVTFDPETRRATVYPLGESGERAYDASGNPLTIDATVAGLLKAHPFLVKPAKGGSGSTPTPSSPPSDGLDALRDRAAKKPNRENLAAHLGAHISQVTE